jgi:pimeloyl-ACP methyl ester carboxylesterase
VSRRLLLLAVSSFALLAAPAAAVAAPAPLTEPREALDAALKCGPGVDGAAATPVVLVHGTGSTPEESFSFGYEKALPKDGFPACTVRLPERAGVDLQRSIQYVVHAIREVARRSGRRVALVGHSQGAMLAAYAPHFWEDLPPLVDDVIGLAGPYLGTQRANDNCADGRCPVTSWQFRMGSAFTKAFAARARPEGVSFTAIATAFDELVTPAPAAARLEGASNLVLQDLCPGRPVEHFAIVGDAAAYALALDALRNRGPADPKRFAAATCAQGTIPGGDPAGTVVTAPQAIGNASVSLVTGEERDAEPPLACPFDQAACSAGGGSGTGSGSGTAGGDRDRPGQRARAPRLTRSCLRGGSLRVRVEPGGVRVRGVTLRAGRRLLARDRRSPFVRVLSRRAVRRGGGTRLRAVLATSRGPLALSRTFPRCGL